MSREECAVPSSRYRSPYKYAECVALRRDEEEADLRNKGDSVDNVALWSIFSWNAECGIDRGDAEDTEIFLRQDLQDEQDWVDRIHASTDARVHVDTEGLGRLETRPYGTQR